MKTTKTTHLHNTERGQSLVELALSFIVIMFLLAGAVDFGMALFSYVVLRDAAKEGATYGSMNPTDISGITSRVRAASPRDEGQFALYPVDVDNDALVDVTVDWTDPSLRCEGVSGGESTGIIVSVEFDYQFSMPLIGPILGRDSIPLRAVATDTILTPACP
jgi:hypothetical protein